MRAKIDVLHVFRPRVAVFCAMGRPWVSGINSLHPSKKYYLSWRLLIHSTWWSIYTRQNIRDSILTNQTRSQLLPYSAKASQQLRHWRTAAPIIGVLRLDIFSTYGPISPLLLVSVYDYSTELMRSDNYHLGTKVRSTINITVTDRGLQLDYNYGYHIFEARLTCRMYMISPMATTLDTNFTSGSEGLWFKLYHLLRGQHTFSKLTRDSWMVVTLGRFSLIEDAPGKEAGTETNK